MRTDHTDAPAGSEYATIYLAFELSKAKWQLGIMMPGAEKMSRYRIDGGDMAALSGVLLRARGKAASKRIRASTEPGQWDRQSRDRCIEHRGEPAGTACQDRSDRSGAADALVPGLPARRGGRLQHSSGPHARGRRSQAAHPRARTVAEGAHRAQQPDQRTAAWPGYPRRQAVEAELPVGSRQAAHRRRARSAAATTR